MYREVEMHDVEASQHIRVYSEYETLPRLKHLPLGIV